MTDTRLTRVFSNVFIQKDLSYTVEWLNSLNCPSLKTKLRIQRCCVVDITATQRVKYDIDKIFKRAAMTFVNHLRILQSPSVNNK